MTNFEKVLEFHEKFKVPIGGEGTIISDERAMLRTRLMSEEHSELIEAMYLRDRVKIAKELGDVLYTVYGTAAEYGIPINAVFREIHRSNMTKEGRKEDDGKIQKGQYYEHPSISRVLQEYEG